ncbi:ABC transporter permease [Streptomyces sp. NPDC002588]|uniref:ABC transporter permease n=1 Tax=Streptomyces sp. NPDC002588 TaxID=3154419 RepID=UPI0033282EFE
MTRTPAGTATPETPDTPHASEAPDTPETQDTQDTQDTPVREDTAAAEGPSVRRFGAVLALARFEARELLFTIQILFFFCLEAGLVVLKLLSTDGMDDYPVLNTVDRGTQTAPVLFAIAVLVCTNAAALRSRKNGTDQLFDVTAMEPWRRTAAHVLSVVPYAALAAVMVAVEHLWAALKPGAIGHGSIGELAVGPLTVLLAGVTGVLLARLLPYAFAPILFVIAFYVVMTAAAAAGAGGTGWGWLSPIVFDEDGGGDPAPSYLLGRPAAWHAVYLLGLVALVICAALLFSGGRTRAVKAAAALALATTAAGAIGQLPHDTAALEAARKTASRTPEKVQSCTEYGGSKYCSFPEWSGVRREWSGVVDRVQSLAGGTAATMPLTVRQRIDVVDGVETDTYVEPVSTPGQVTVGTRWGGNRVPEFAVGVASVLVAGKEDVALDDLCRDARMVTIMWLVLGADPTPTDTFQNVRLNDSTAGADLVLDPTNPLEMSAAQTTVVRELLNRPRAEVTARVKEHWTELTSSATTPAQAARLLGVKAPKEAATCDE